VQYKKLYLVFLAVYVLSCFLMYSFTGLSRELNPVAISDRENRWIIINGEWKYENGGLYGEVETGKALIYLDAQFRNINIECTINPVSGRAGVIFYMQNVLNYYELVLERQELFFILRMTNDTRYLASSKLPKEKYYVFKIIQEEDTVAVLLNNSLLFKVNDDTFTSGFFGLSVQNGKASFSNINVKGDPPIVLKNDSFDVSIDEKYGSIKSLLGSLDDGTVQFCNNTPLSPSNPWGWGTVILDYGEDLITSKEMRCRVYSSKGEVLTEYTGDKIRVEIKRRLSGSFLDEIYTINSFNELTLNTLGVVFRPDITMHVGEQSSYFLVENTPMVYHWFTGKNLAYLLVTHNNGRPPHLAIVLMNGEINGYTLLYNLGVKHIPLGASPVLFVTGKGIDGRKTEYTQPEIYIRPNKPLSFTLRYFLFKDWKDMEDKILNICKQPVFRYPRYIPVGKYMDIEVEVPQDIEITSVKMDGTEVLYVKVADDKYLVKALVKSAGLKRIDFSFSDGRETFILFEGMQNIRTLLNKRAEFILNYQIDSNPDSLGFLGIFPIDLLNKKSMASSQAGNCQQAGTGEITASALIPIYKNLVDPQEDEIKKIELYANEWLRGKCQDKDYACYLNPLNKAAGGDGMGFRIWNANWIATVYYYLSLFENRYLKLQTRDTYLLWAYNTLKWFFSNKPTYISPEPHMIRKVINELYNRNYKKEAKDLEEATEHTIKSILSQSRELEQKGKEWVMDANAFVPMATFLFIEGYDKEAYTFLDPTITDLGYSYDPRIQSAFRIWDDAASGYHYKLIPYPTMPHFWTSIVGYPLLLAYERYDKEEFLESAYNSIMSLYESYNSDYPFNLWGKMELGEAHSAFLPGLGLNTQERACSDQDGSFSTYLETFGTKCYITKTGRSINCSREDSRIVSWAAYPREYILEDAGYIISTAHISTVINSVKLKNDSIIIEIENLRKDDIETELKLSSIDKKSLKSMTIKMKALEKQFVEIRI